MKPPHPLRPLAEPPLLHPRVSLASQGAPLAQVVHEGVEWAIDTIAHADDGERLTLTVSGPLRALEHGNRAEQAAVFAGEISRRVKGKAGRREPG